MNKAYQNQEKSATIGELDEDQSVRRVVITPNSSLDATQALVVVGVFVVVLLSIGGYFCSRGLWLVLPFAGLELFALTLSFYVCLRRNYSYQVIKVDSREIRIISGSAAGEIDYRLQTYWSQVWLEITQGWYPSKLWITSKGEKVELGGWLTEEERCHLAVKLKKMICY